MPDLPRTFIGSIVLGVPSLTDRPDYKKESSDTAHTKDAIET